MLQKIILIMCGITLCCCSRIVSNETVSLPELVKLKPGIANITKYNILREGSIQDKSKDIEIKDLLFSTQTITISQWDGFLKKTNYKYWKWDENIDPGIYFSDLQKCPIVSVTWYEALLYCNWLSREKGLDAVYEIKGKVDRNNASLPVVIWHKDRNGYRLPTPEEWQYGIYQEYQDVDSVLNAIKQEEDAAIKTDGAFDSKNRSRSKIFGSKDVFRNSLGVYINLSQNIDEYVWGFGVNNNGVIVRHYGEINLHNESSPDLSKTDVLCFYQNTVSSYRAKEAVYCTSFRVVRNNF